MRKLAVLGWDLKPAPTMSKCPVYDFEPSPEKEVTIVAPQSVRTQPLFVLVTHGDTPL